MDEPAIACISEYQFDAAVLVFPDENAHETCPRQASFSLAERALQEVVTWLMNSHIWGDAP